MSYEIKGTKVSGVEPRQFRPGGKLHYKVRIYLEPTDNDSLSDIRSVQYKLHPTFREQFRVSDDSRNNFEIQIWTWGYFMIEATIIMTNGSTELVENYVDW
jgi:transcription initiation factor IIF auxiliary subunit